MKNSRFLILFISIMIFLIQMIWTSNVQALSDCAQGETNCWDCGKTENDLCTARLNNRELKITGTGDMRDYGYLNWAPWCNAGYTTLTIENGITSLGDWSFTYASITSVTIPDSVKSIGAYAIDSCYNLVDIKIPDSVTTIGEKAFGWTPYYDNNMSGFFLPESVTSIASDAFYDAKITTVYCAESTPGCTNSGKMKVYTTDEKGVYKIGGDYYASPDAILSGTTCNNTDTGDTGCQALAAAYQMQKAENMAGGALCKTQNDCLDLINMANKKTVCSSIADCKSYGSAHGIGFGYPYTVSNTDGSVTMYNGDGTIKGYKGKRIYTVKEANEVSKPTGNRVSLRYK